MKVLFVFLFLCFCLLSHINPVFAIEIEAGRAGTLASSFTPFIVDTRVAHLKAFLRTYNSPLENSAVTFIREADAHNIDWKLVAAIAGTESTFGKRIPPGCSNAWGWGIPTGAQSGICFKNWDDGIKKVTRGLKERYMNHGATTLEQIGHIYATSPFWAQHVGFFMDKITNFIPKDTEMLQVSI